MGALALSPFPTELRATAAAPPAIRSPTAATANARRLLPPVRLCDEAGLTPSVASTCSVGSVWRGGGMGAVRGCSTLCGATAGEAEPPRTAQPPLSPQHSA